MDKITISPTLGGLEEAAERILKDSPTGKPVLQSIRDRRKWHQIKMEYRDLKEEIGGSEARRSLSEKWHYSEKTIESIIYKR